MYSNSNFINVICSLKEKFKDFNEKELKESDLEKINKNDIDFIRQLNKIKKNHFDSIIKDLLDNIDFFDFIYSYKKDFINCNTDEESKILYAELKSKYENYSKQDITKDLLNLNNLKNNIKNFKLKNILFKGVPGTGKSHKIDKIITDKLKLEKDSKNVLRVNIHSASSNADLMQGIAISTEKDQVSYKEKQGLIFKHIQKACFSPYEPFVLVLEEIQENSLNELIGDLIYLIEDNKRAKITKDLNTDIFLDKQEYSYTDLIDLYIENMDNPYYVEIPNLVSINEKNRKMIMPDNLYIFCTSNYRDDKKVIEDNLLRRFDVIEVYPQYKKTLKEDFNSQYISNFLEALNNSILHTFESFEIHPDRFLIGHANWLKINNTSVTKEQDFYKALLKVIIEFKEIREIDFSQGIKKIFINENFAKYLKSESDEDWVIKAFNEINTNKLSYEKLVTSLQDKVYKEILELK